MHIVVADKMEKEVRDQLGEFGRVDYFGDTPAGEEKDARFRDALNHAEVLIIRSETKVTVALIESAPQLKIVARAGVGLDNVDQRACAAKGIEVWNTPGAHSINVTEHALALLLAVAKQLETADHLMRLGEWPKNKVKPIELRGKTLGLVGFGRIGQSFGEIAHALGMKILFFDSKPDLRSDFAMRTDLEMLLRSSDVVSLHLPMLDSVLIDRTAFSVMKDGAILINTARGGLVDENALIEALSSGKLFGAGIDVFGHEPYPQDGPLRKIPSVLITPHIASATKEAQLRCGLEIVRRLSETCDVKVDRTDLARLSRPPKGSGPLTHSPIKTG